MRQIAASEDAQATGGCAAAAPANRTAAAPAMRAACSTALNRGPGRRSGNARRSRCVLGDKAASLQVRSTAGPDHPANAPAPIPVYCNRERPNRPSPQLLRAAQARDHGDPQQVVVGAPLVGRDLRQAATELAAVRLEVALVLDRLFLDVFERHQPALLVVARELRLGPGPTPDVDHARGQVDRVM